jgi:hypothetical protein
MIGAARDAALLCRVPIVDEFRVEAVGPFSRLDVSEKNSGLAYLSPVNVGWLSAPCQLSRCLEAPIRQIAENSGVVGKVLEKSGNFGFDAQKEEYVDMVTAGIIDPTKVVRIALGRGIHRLDPDHHRSDDRREAEGQGSGHARRRRRHGRRHGRHGFLIHPRSRTKQQAVPGNRGGIAFRS